jgi:glycosyltransferase involved in cell wall biosynthesis
VLPVSVVIITKNEERNIIDCIHSARRVSDDIIVVDSGSIDNTVLLAEREGVRVVLCQWKGYGYSRNLGADQANNDWIFSLDADERITRELAETIDKADLSDAELCFRFKRKNYFLRHPLQFGTLAFDKPCRLYNRKNTSWDLSPVHEELVAVKKKRKTIHDGRIIHLAVSDLDSYAAKLDAYAYLCAMKYHGTGRKADLLRRIVNPVFAGVKSYIFQLGFLDGKYGYQLAKMAIRYTWLKYQHLHRMNIQGETTARSRVPLTEIVKATA